MILMLIQQLTDIKTAANKDLFERITLDIFNASLANGNKKFREFHKLNIKF